MPCTDVTEHLEITLDQSDRLASYSFTKRSCGQGIGLESLLIDCLKGQTVEDLLAYTAESFLEHHPAPDELEEFLGLKHLFAIQGALEVYTGEEPGGKNDAFAAAGIDHDEHTTTIHGLIAIDLLTEKIKSCGNCASCGSGKA